MAFTSLLYFLLAIVSALFGFGGIASRAAGMAQVSFFVFIVLFILSVMSGVAHRENVTHS